jgi:hypothetical protein
MFRRVIALLGLLTTAALLGDAAQILCFGEDGHVAFERLIGAEHLGAGAPTTTAESIAHAAGERSERMHVDVSVEAGVKSRLATSTLPGAAIAPARTSVLTATAVVAPRLEAEAPSICALRTTVLRI